MTRLDGTVLAGRLVDALGCDATAAAGCGSHGALAGATVYVSTMGSVACCPHCDASLATFVESDTGRMWFGMPGISALEVTRS